MKILGSSKSTLAKDKNVLELEIAEMMLVPRYIANNQYQHHSKVSCKIVLNKLFG